MPDYARMAYEAYAEHQEWTNDQGNPIPPWHEVPQDIKDAWTHAVDTVIDAYDKPR
jgi:hypothetical protein